MMNISGLIKAGILLISAAGISFSGTISVKADDDTIPQIKTIAVNSYWDFTGKLEYVYNIDIDNDGVKEQTASYVSLEPGTIIESFYDIYDGGTEPVTLYITRSNDHVHYALHVIQDQTAGECYIGYEYTNMFGSRALYKLYPQESSEPMAEYYGDGDETGTGMTISEYTKFMKNITFLDELAYGKSDTDGDAEVTLNDASMILSHYASDAAGLKSDLNAAQKNAADTNSDGTIALIDASDALSLYAQKAAGLLDTVIAPRNVKPDAYYAGYYYTLITGELESTLYYDIDNDGVKETIARYHNTNLDGSDVMAQDYVYQVYDNGIYCDTFGFNPSAGMVKVTHSLIRDYNTNEVYLASITSRCVAMYGYATICREFPKLNDGSDGHILSINVNATDESQFVIYGVETSEQEVRDYISNLEIINPCDNKENELAIFDYIRNTYTSDTVSCTAE